MGKLYSLWRKRYKWIDKADNDDGNIQMPPPPHPTSACPGTEEKIAVMEYRVVNNYMPHHVDDYREDKRPR